MAKGDANGFALLTLAGIGRGWRSGPCGLAGKGSQTGEYITRAWYQAVGDNMTSDLEPFIDANLLRDACHASFPLIKHNEQPGLESPARHDRNLPALKLG